MTTTATTNYATPKHDSILKFISSEKNRYKVVEFVAKHRGFSIDKDSFGSSFLAEIPIFSKNDTRRFICDGIINLYSSKDCSAPPSTSSIATVTPTSTSNPQMINPNGLVLKSFSGKELHLMREAVYRKIITESKPRLDSISNTLGQMHTYSHYMKYSRWLNGVKSNRLSEPDLVLLTLDGDMSFDSICFQQSVLIFHISPIKH